MKLTTPLSAARLSTVFLTPSYMHHPEVSGRITHTDARGSCVHGYSIFLKYSLREGSIEGGSVHMMAGARIQPTSCISKMDTCHLSKLILINDVEIVPV